MFALMAVLAAVFTDLRDRSLPLESGASAAVTLEFSESGLSDQEAFAELGRLSDELNLGLVMVTGDVGADQSGQVLTVVGERRTLPARLVRFGDLPDVQVRGPEALEHSIADGHYLITGDEAGRVELQEWLTQRQVGQFWKSDGHGATLRMIAIEGAFAACFVATVVLLVTVAVYWLAARARQRALRVLAGTAPSRIVVEDIIGLTAPITLSALAVHAVAAVYVAVAHGSGFLPYFMTTLALLQLLVVFATLAAVVVLSVVSWPKTAALARREPAVRRYRPVATAMKVLTFVLVISAVAPAYGALRAATAAADEQAQWRLLADQVGLTFRLGANEGEFNEIKGPVTSVALRAERDGAVSLSHAWSADDLNLSGQERQSYGGLALVTQRWLDLIETDHTDLTAVSVGDLPQAVRSFLLPSLEIWQRDTGADPGELVEAVSYYRFDGELALPVVGSGSGQLVFFDRVVLAVVPELGMFNEDFLASSATSSNLIFTGLEATQQLVAEEGLTGAVRVQYMAEDGLLLAQFLAYFAWLRGISLAAMLAAMVISAAVGSVISAVLDNRRDYQLRLAGTSAVRILANRLAPEVAVGLALVAAILALTLWRDSPGTPLIITAGSLGLAISALCHFAARRWMFSAVINRTV
ncbi:hypothetical protein [Micromonospora eburnea]|uniref:hypothetical protein n=1 Tax=Micromonospora eburnea TaxID=227316 RepID=UPI00114CCF09|nr:hypothetical protein [Micromonospora eburnea]